MPEIEIPVVNYSRI